MKLLARFLGMTVIGLLFLQMFMYYGSINTRMVELEEITQEAFSQTQSILVEQKKDELFDTRGAEITFSSNDDYRSYFISTLAKLITSNSKYTIDVYALDYQKGLISIAVNCTYNTVFATKKVLTTRKTSIIDIYENVENPADKIFKRYIDSKKMGLKNGSIWKTSEYATALDTALNKQSPASSHPVN